MSPELPKDFANRLTISNAKERLAEAQNVGDRIQAAGVPLMANPDHAAVFVDPPHVLAGPLKRIGYLTGWDARCYPSPVDGQDYINVSAALPDGHAALDDGWPKYVAVVHPVDETARSLMLAQGYGNPFLHHITWGIVPPDREPDEDELTYAGRVVTFMVKVRQTIGETIGDTPGTLIVALPSTVVNDPNFPARRLDWVGDLSEAAYQFEEMDGGGYLLQFFVLSGGRIEVALRIATRQTFNPKSVHKISEDEISTVQD